MQGTKVVFVSLIVLFLCAYSSATCSGSGLTWSCTAGSTSSQVQTAIDNASDTATITIANGTTNWSVSVNNRNGVTLICATVGGCTNSASGNIFTNDFCSANKTNLIRLSGFVFTGNPSSGLIWMYCSGTFTLSQVRIDHNEFSGLPLSSIAILFGETSTSSRIFGVVDHNNFHGSTNFMGMKNVTGGINSSGWLTNQQGGANAMFFEDNICNFTNMGDNGTGCMDVWRANSTVIRFNNMFNGRMVNHSYCHGGPYNAEVYGNTINTPGDTPAQFRNIHFQGSGEEIVFGNTVEINAGSTITVQNFRSSGDTGEGDCGANQCTGSSTGTGADPSHPNDGNRAGQQGYRCWHQPGSDVNGTLKPIYNFMNHNAAGTNIALSADNSRSALVADRDYYDAVSASAQTSTTSPFNGTTGMGFGTLARRPTTCTATPQAADAGNGGVGYWATDQGSWNTSGNGFGNGVLYRCSATNTWTVAYTPYTYPHPLVGGGTSLPFAQLSPSSITFPNQNVGTSSAAMSTVLTNTGTAIMNISSIAITGPVSSGDFSQSNTCSTTLAVSASCSINVIFTPSGPTTSSGNVTVTSDSSNSPTSTSLSGTGIIGFSSLVGVTVDGSVTIH